MPTAFIRRNRFVGDYQERENLKFALYSLRLVTSRASSFTKGKGGFAGRASLFRSSMKGETKPSLREQSHEISGHSSKPRPKGKVVRRKTPWATSTTLERACDVL